jgi:hypothetical protein
LFIIFSSFTISHAQIEGIPRPTPNPHPGYTFVSSNCHQVKLGFVNITSGSEIWINEAGQTITIPCDDGDRWHWFWE